MNIMYSSKLEVIIQSCTIVKASSITEFSLEASNHIALITIALQIIVSSYAIHLAVYS